MDIDMKQWLGDMLATRHKKPLPILAFPSIQLLDVSVKDLISNSTLQAAGLALIAKQTNMAAAVSLMDLSLEAECFGSEISISDSEVPTVKNILVHNLAEAKELPIPSIGAGRTQIYLDAIKLALPQITDRPLLAGAIGPFSLAGRLLGVSEVMTHCFMEVELLHTILEKATAFITQYLQAYKALGANGVLLAEPLTGLLSPALAADFSAPYVKRIIDAVQDERFILVYHNCGDTTIKIIDTILSTGAAAYHFGNAVDMAEMLTRIPASTIVMGNLDPASELYGGTPHSVRRATLQIMEKCGGYANFIISSGCDIPPLSPWENIEAFFAAVEEFYGR